MGSEGGRIKQLEEQSEVLRASIDAMAKAIAANTEAIRLLAVQVKQNTDITR